MGLNTKVKENYTAFQNQMFDLFSSKLDTSVFKNEFAKKADLKEHDSLVKRFQDLSTEIDKDVRSLLIGKLAIFKHYFSISLTLIWCIGKMQELQTLVDTKASQVEVDILNQYKVNWDSFEDLNNHVEKIEKDLNNKINVKDEDNSITDWLEYSIDESKTDSDNDKARHRRNTFGFGDFFLNEIERKNKEGIKATQKDVIKYHQVQVNDLSEHVLENEKVMNNMKHEIIKLREENAKQAHAIEETKRKQ